jgi:hypothetical protein
VTKVGEGTRFWGVVVELILVIEMGDEKIKVNKLR